MERRTEQRRSAPRTKKVIAGIAALSLSGAVSGCGIKPGSGYDHLPAQLKVQGTSNGPQHVREQLNCYSTLTYPKGNGAPKVEEAKPREIEYIGTTERRVWGAETDVTFGVIDVVGNKVTKHLRTVTVWVAQNYRGPHSQLVTFDFSDGELPMDWANTIHYPYMPEENGHEMMQVHDPQSPAGPASVRQAPHIVEYSHGGMHDITEYDHIFASCYNGGEPIPLAQHKLVYVPNQTWTKPMAPQLLTPGQP